MSRSSAVDRNRRSFDKLTWCPTSQQGQTEDKFGFDTGRFRMQVTTSGPQMKWVVRTNCCCIQQATPVTSSTATVAHSHQQ